MIHVFKRSSPLCAVSRNLASKACATLRVASMALATCVVGGLTPTGHAQCSGQWLSGSGVPGVSAAADLGLSGEVRAIITWDPDGGGPQGSVLVVAGSFSFADETNGLNRVAVWNGTSWSNLGTGMDGNGVFALAAMPNGDLIAGGLFTSAGGQPASNIARWSGGAWSNLGAGVNGAVNTLAVMPDNSVIAGGSFLMAGGNPASRVASWNGTTWSALGTGAASTVNALAVTPGGVLIAGGAFASAGGASNTRGVAKWSGGAWSGLGGSGPLGVGFSATALLALPDGDVLIGGNFASVGGVTANRIVRWNATNGYSAVGSGLGSTGSSASVNALARTSSGTIIAGGNFTTANGALSSYIAQLNGSTWSSLGTGITRGTNVRALHVTSTGAVAVGGSFLTTGNVAVSNIGLWSGTAWSAIGSGTNSSLSAFTVMSNGDVVAGGSFDSIHGVAANSVARWNGSAWLALGSGMDDSISGLASKSNGDIYAVGRFTTAGGITVNGVARWNGTAWSDLGGQTAYANSAAVAIASNGDVLVGGTFGIARWNGTSWSSVATLSGSNVIAIAVLPNGHLVAGGVFTTIGGVVSNGLAEYNGNAWSSLWTNPSGDNRMVSALQVVSGGLVVGGRFDDANDVTVNNIAYWNGSTWSALGSGVVGTVSALSIAANGDLIVGGAFTDPAKNIARWNGSTWMPMNVGTEGSVVALAAKSDGLLYAGGNFRFAGGQVSSYLACWQDCGVCCAANGSCTVVSGAANCPSGVFSASQSSCTPNPCGAISTGACCTGASCASKTESECSGSFKGPNTACETTNCCIANFNGVGGVTVADIFAFLNAWFAGQSSANVNGVGGVTVADIFFFLNHWFAGC